MRHARAESAAASDEQRELTAGGRADAAAAGRWLAQEGYAVDAALVSTARRTRETWDALAGAAGFEVEPEFDGGVYAGGPESVHDLLRLTPDSARSLLVIGHNPTISYLAQLLDDGDGDADAVAAMAGGYPPCALAVFRVPRSWDELEVGRARLLAFHVGQGE
jgi:phosphohistidine phosphatase